MQNITVPLPFPDVPAVATLDSQVSRVKNGAHVVGNSSLFASNNVTPC